jgi:hypothetical protein
MAYLRTMYSVLDLENQLQIMIDITCAGDALLHVSSALFGYHITGNVQVLCLLTEIARLEYLEWNRIGSSCDPPLNLFKIYESARVGLYNMVYDSIVCSWFLVSFS